jgi:hypothetical protein
MIKIEFQNIREKIGNSKSGAGKFDYLGKS